MKRRDHVIEAELIGIDSYELFNFADLPASASPQEQYLALVADMEWQRSHTIEITRRIERLAKKIYPDGDGRPLS